MIYNPVVLFSALLTLDYFSCIVVHLKMREINNNWPITLCIISVNLEITLLKPVKIQTCYKQEKTNIHGSSLQMKFHVFIAEANDNSSSCPNTLLG